MKKWLKIVFTIICIAISSSICFFLPKDKTETITKSTEINEKTSITITEEIKRPFWQLFLEWVAVGSIVTIIWIWRKELGINGILGVEGSDPKIEQQEPDPKLIPEAEKSKDKITIINSPIISSTESSTNNTKKEIDKQLYTKKLDEFLKNYTSYGFFYAHNFADYIKSPIRLTEELLYDYVNKGILRIDANPKKIFSFANSYENQIINYILHYISKDNIITKEVRFARFENIEFDALFETEKSVFICEVKINPNFQKHFDLMLFIKRLDSFANKFQKAHKFIVLGIGYNNDEEYDKAYRYARSYSYNDKETRLIILPVKLEHY